MLSVLARWRRGGTVQEDGAHRPPAHEAVHALFRGSTISGHASTICGDERPRRHPRRCVTNYACNRRALLQEWLTRMEIIAHGLWATAAAITAKRSTDARLRIGWMVWWGVFPDVLAFGPSIAAGLWLGLAGILNTGHGHVRLVHVGPPLYPAAHSLIVFLVVFGTAAILARRIVFEMLGWLLHILIDIPTHSLRYYATRFLWPMSDFRIDGIAWWTPWFWASTYGALVAVYFLIWKKGWLSRARSPEDAESFTGANQGGAQASATNRE